MSDGRADRGHLSPLDTSLTHNVHADSDLFYRLPLSNTTNIKQLSPSPAISPSSLNNDPPLVQNVNSRARNESRKLLSHVLLQLGNRKKPDSIIDTIARVKHDFEHDGFSAFGESLKDAFKIGSRQDVRSEKRAVTSLDDSDDESADIFTTDETYDLMMQLLDVLTLSVAQGWHIFDDFDESPVVREYGVDGERDSRISSAFRRPRSGSKRSRSSSPVAGRAPVPNLLSLCISILNSVVSEDCRYRTVLPRPSRPPNSLQVLTLNIAQFLLHAHRHNSRIIYQITFAMIPAFYTFSPSMYMRLLLFFESSIVNTALKSLEHARDPTIKSQSLFQKDSDFIKSSNPEEGAPISIQIDEVHGENAKTSPNIDTKSGLQSTNNPRQSSSVYYLAFLFPPLLTAMLDALDHSIVSQASGDNHDLFMKFASILKLIASSKQDAYNDLLEIVAYRSGKPRRIAIAALASLWPKSVGHTIISQPLCAVDGFLHSVANPFAHQFVPWYFDGRRSVNLEHTLHDNCRSCSKIIVGFALLCPFCMTAVHFDCYDYPEGNYETQYSMAQDPQVQRIAMYRFSRVQISAPTIISKSGHKFELLNWFTLSLCFVCRLPLWGCFAQGFKCKDCPFSLHHSCISSLDLPNQCGVCSTTSADLMIQGNTLRLSCMEHFPILRCSRTQLEDCTYEEIAIFHAVLWTQLRILINGIEFGSVVVQNEDNATESLDQGLVRFEIHRVIDICDELLNAGGLVCSPLMRQYYQDFDTTKTKPSVMHNWSFLEYITAAVKASFPQTRDSHHTPSDLLTVDPFAASLDDDIESATYPLESVSLSHIRNILATDFSLRSDDAALFLINQLHHLSLLERIDDIQFQFEDISLEKDVRCIFPLPLGLDLSMNVETLVSSIEASLEELDLSTNEFGFLLLTRRFWPNVLASDYGLRRLTTKVVWWILSEGDNLATVLRDFVAKKKSPPGIPTMPRAVWPLSSDIPTSSSGLASNGSDYISARRALLSKFALPWLLELHNLHPLFYCQTIFDTCHQFALSADSESPNLIELSGKSYVLHSTSVADKVLRAIIKLCHVSIIFSVFDALFALWIDFLFNCDEADKPISSLPRLWASEHEAGHRSSFTMDSPAGILELSDLDPLRAIYNFANRSPEDLSKSLIFLSSVVRSGIFVPTEFFRRLLGLVLSNADNNLENANLLVKAIALSLWLRSFGRQDLQSLISDLHVGLSPKIAESLSSGQDVLTSISIIRYSLAACLRLCGCERSGIVATGMITSEEVQQLPSLQVRKAGIRGSRVVDPVTIEVEVLKALQIYMSTNLDDICGLAAKFLSMFLMNSPFLESFEVDNFVIRNGKIIAQCAWTVYGIQHDDLAVVRINLLLKTLLVDPEPFHDILHMNLDPVTSPLNDRLSSINRVFRMVSDVTSPAFNVEGRQWRSSISETFYAFFSALWTDDSEEIRTTVRASVATLLPGHFEVISQCWNESLARAPISERTRLVSFLLQLRPHFISWRVLGWESIIDTLVQYDYDPTYVRPAFASSDEASTMEKTLSRTDPDLAQLRVSLILLSLQMMADGVEIDNFSIMKLKIQFVQIAGFSQISVIPSQNGQSVQLLFGDASELSSAAYVCIEELPHLVDAPHYCNLPPLALGIPDSQDDKAVNVLIGSAFLDVTLSLLSTVRDISSLPVSTLKCLLEALYIIIHKYDFESQLFSHLRPMARKALLRVAEILSTDMSYELRQLSLSISQAAVKNCSSFLGPAVSTILELVANEVASEIRNMQDFLVVHGKQLIGNTLQSFCNSGLLMILMKRPLQPTFFTVLSQVFDPQGNFVLRDVCDALLRDTLARAVECDSVSFQSVMRNILYFVEIVYSQGYTLELVIFVGQQLTGLARRMTDGTIEGADSSPLISVSSILLQNHKRYAKEFLPYIDTLLRVALNRLHVESSCLRRLIEVASVLRPTVQQEVSSSPIDIVHTLVEILSDGLKMKTKVMPVTIKCLIDTLINERSNTNYVVHNSFLQNINEGAYIFLQNHAWHEENIQNDFQAVLVSGKLLLRASSQDPTVFQKIKESRYPFSIKSWNILLLATLQEGHIDWMSAMYSHFPTFSATFSFTLRSYVNSGISSTSAATTDVNQAHIAMKGWLMIVNMLSRQYDGRESMVSSVWNELWAAFESFLTVVETEAQAGLHLTLVTLVSTSVADLFLFIHSLRISLTLDTSYHILTLIRLRTLNRGESSLNKISRAIRSMTEPPSDLVSWNFLMDQLAKELVAAEKIRLIEVKRDNGRFTSDNRHRKEGTSSGQRLMLHT